MAVPGLVLRTDHADGVSHARDSHFPRHFQRIGDFSRSLRASLAAEGGTPLAGTIKIAALRNHEHTYDLTLASPTGAQSTPWNKGLRSSPYEVRVKILPYCLAP